MLCISVMCIKKTGATGIGATALYVDTINVFSEDALAAFLNGWIQYTGSRYSIDRVCHVPIK